MGYRASFATAHGPAIVKPMHTDCSVKDVASRRPIDLVHLSKQSLGDRDLEQEVLSLFKSQSVLYLDRLRQAKTSDQRKMAAHTILGSARGIGAWQVAECAADVEHNFAHLSDLSELEAAIVQANDYIGSLQEA